jgi:thiol:disulfide interchange protein DsbD
MNFLNQSFRLSAFRSRSWSRVLLLSCFFSSHAWAFDPDSPEAFAAALGSGSWVAIGAAFFLAGLLLSLTPRVLPLAPIMWNSLGGGSGARPSRLRGLALCASFALGMSIFYALAGVVAALAGQSLAPVLQSPAAIAAFALVLACLGASSLGAFQLRLPSAWEGAASSIGRRLPGGRFGAAFALGALSALVAGPCIAPPLAGALAFISQTRDAALGAFALFFLAWGMCAPIAAFGAGLGALLPKPGPASQAIQRLFGCILLALAWREASFILPPSASLALLGFLLLFFCFYWLPKTHGHATPADTRVVHTPWRSARLALCSMLALAGLFELIGAASGSAQPLMPLDRIASSSAAPLAAPASTTPSLDAAGPGLASSPAQGSSQTPSFAPISSWEQLSRLAQGSKKPVLLEISASWCVACEEMRSKTYPDPQVQAMLARFELVELDASAMSPDTLALMKRFSIFGPPALLAFSAGSDAATPTASALGYMAPAALMSKLSPALSP